MIAIVRKPLAAEVTAYLSAVQMSIDALPAYADRVADAKNRWANKNRSHFVAVRDALFLAQGKNKRCAYCEDSCADEVEHIAPKDLYPERAFVYDNYLMSCGPCNGPKNNKYVVDDNGSIRIVERKRNDPVIPPVGNPAFIDPFACNPLDYIVLSLSDFRFAPNPTKSVLDQEKANRTIEILGLNTREHLIGNRKTAYGNFVAQIYRWIQAKQGNDAAEMASVKANISDATHKTVWWEMLRQRLLHPQLTNLFVQAPELLTVR